MQALRDDIGRLAGLAATHELASLGWGRRALAGAVARGDIIRVRQGWYGRRELHPTLVRCVRVGGPATCVTGLQLMGAWVIRDDDVHVRVHQHASRLRDPAHAKRRLERGAVAHWSGREPLARLILDPIDSLEDMLGCQPTDLVAAAADSLLHKRPALLSRWRSLIATAPPRMRAQLALVDGVCESGTETIVWQRLGRRLGLRRQVRIPAVGRVDFLLGARLVIEVDGFEHHSDRGDFEHDRQRDALLSALGYRVLRFSYSQVLERWDEVEASILAARARGDHF